MTLTDYLQTVYIPSREAAGRPLMRSTRGAYRVAIDRVAKFAGREVEIEEVDRRFIGRFWEWARRFGYSSHTIRGTIQFLQAVSNHYRANAVASVEAV